MKIRDLKEYDKKYVYYEYDGSYCIFKLNYDKVEFNARFNDISINIDKDITIKSNSIEYREKGMLLINESLLKNIKCIDNEISDFISSVFNENIINRFLKD